MKLAGDDDSEDRALHLTPQSQAESMLRFLHAFSLQSTMKDRLGAAARG